MLKSVKKINYIMYLYYIKIFSKIKKKLDTLLQTTKIYSQDIGR